jgi:hypothetical protein
VTPISRITSSFGRVIVPGSHSNVISLVWVHDDTRSSRDTSERSWRVDKNDGVPPPT